MPLSPDERNQYKSLYLQSARKYVKELQDNLALLQQGKETPEVIETIHRDAHSMKGQSEMMSYTSVHDLSMAIEFFFQEKIEKGFTLSAEVIAKFVEAANALSECLDQIEKDNQEKDLSSFTENIKSLPR